MLDCVLLNLLRLYNGLDNNDQSITFHVDMSGAVGKYVGISAEHAREFATDLLEMMPNVTPEACAKLGEAISILEALKDMHEEKKKALYIEYEKNSPGEYAAPTNMNGIGYFLASVRITIDALSRLRHDPESELALIRPAKKRPRQ